VLPSLQFTDFHKFLVSVGGLACVAAGALPIFLLRTQKTVSVTTKQLTELSPDARTATEIQQAQVLWLLNSWPVISAALLAGGIALIIIGAVIWKRRQDVLNSKEAAEIRKIDAESEKAQQESVALSRANQETPKETEVALEEKATEVGDAQLEGEILEAGTLTTSESRAETVRPAPTAGAALSALQAILAASEDLAPEARGLIKLLSSQELTLQAIEREFPDADIVRNVRIIKDRADFVVTTKHQSMPGIVVDVTRLPPGITASLDIYDRRRDWADRITLQAPSILKINIRPVVVLIISESMHPTKARELPRMLGERVTMDDDLHAAASVILITNAALEKRRPILGLTSAPHIVGGNSAFSFIH
jgi:hypothetical protein